MKNKTVRQMLPMHLQFFATKDDDLSEAGTDDQGSGDDGNDDDVDDGNDGGQQSEKTFTQAEVTAMMTREKKEGRKAMLKQLGFKTESEAQQAVALYTALLNSQKSDDEKAKDHNAGLENAKTEAEKRAEAAENKLACMEAGVKKDSVDDVLAIAKLKVTEEKNLGKVLAEMKKDQRYATFFGESGKEDGTGSDPGHSKQGGGEKKGALGERLAKSSKQADTKKSSYF